jgi:peptidylprolyl isomerase
MTDKKDLAILELKSGPVTIEFRSDLAPNHVARIKELISQGYYDGLKFHRVIRGFMAQTGCPDGTGMGGSGQKIKAEFSDEPFVRGTVGAARSMNPNSADSQFFITFGATPHLDGEYTVWGQVIDGMEHVDKIAVGEPPREPDTIIKFSLDKEEAKERKKS